MKTTIQICMLVFIFLTSDYKAITIRGKVYDDNKNPVSNLTIRFSTYGSITTTNSGEFIIEIPSQVRTVEIELSEENWDVIYPFDKRIPVPVDPDFISKIIVTQKSDKTPDKIEDAVDEFKKLEVLLKDIGIAQSQLLSLVEEYVKKESEQQKFDEQNLREAIIKEKQADIYSEISHTLLKYVYEAQNVKNDFRNVLDLAFENINANRELVTALSDYNSILDKLNNNKYAYQNNISVYWKDEDMSEDLIELLDYTIDEIHKPYFLSLNDKLVQMNRIVSGYIQNKDEKERVKNQIRTAVFSNLTELDTRLPVLEKKTNKYLQKLKNGNG